MRGPAALWAVLSVGSLLAALVGTVGWATASVAGLAGRPFSGARPGPLAASAPTTPTSPSNALAAQAPSAETPAMPLLSSPAAGRTLIELAIPFEIAPFVASPRSEGAFAALSALPAVERLVRAPILMYHHVGPAPTDADALRRDLTVAAPAFERQLDYLKSAGFQTITMEALTDALEGIGALPPRPVVLTFDDGYLDNYQYALPALLQRGMVGTFFIVTGLLGHLEYLGWGQVRAMAAAGMEMQAHGWQHLDMSRLRDATLRDQLAGSRAELERATGLPVRIFAYPGGSYRPAVIAALKEAGYRSALTTRHGYDHRTADRYELRRVRGRGSDTLPVFAAKLNP